MTGLVKAKKYDWKDSNMALVGTDTDRSVKKEAAETEPAWNGAGQHVGVQIWRIVKFKVEHWPKEDYGKFYNGDSYIILNTYKDPDGDQLLYDVHFWIGKYSTQDEYGTAAYKTVELDTLLDDKPVQHREVQNHESKLFRSYFNPIVLMEGGADTGFRHVKPEEYKPRLLHFKAEGKKVSLKEVPINRNRLNSGDVFILDLGQKAIEWCGTSSSNVERFKASQYLPQLSSERNGRVITETVDEDEIDESHEFYEALDKHAVEDDDDDEDEPDQARDPKLFRVSDASGALNFTLEKEGDVSYDDFDSSDAFILDVGTDIFLWLGRNCSEQEKQSSMAIVHNYTQESDNPLCPCTSIKEGQRNRAFETAIAA